MSRLFSEKFHYLLITTSNKLLHVVSISKIVSYIDEKFEDREACYTLSLLEYELIQKKIYIIFTFRKHYSPTILKILLFFELLITKHFGIS